MLSSRQFVDSVLSAHNNMDMFFFLKYGMSNLLECIAHAFTLSCELSTEYSVSFMTFCPHVSCFVDLNLMFI